jgi:ribosomal protein S18 acetylase RimI-like enzyme
VINQLIPGYTLRPGSGLDRALLVKFMQRTYQELYPDHTFPHLAQTVDQYLSTDTPIWWVDPQPAPTSAPATRQPPSPIACLWLGNAVDQIQGDRHAHIFLLYVSPAHRHRGIGSALMQQAEAWATARGDRQIGLQVFHHNQPALQLYEKLGYQPQSYWMVKPLKQDEG